MGVIMGTLFHSSILVLTQRGLPFNLTMLATYLLFKQTTKKTVISCSLRSALLSKIKKIDVLNSLDFLLVPNLALRSKEKVKKYYLLVREIIFFNPAFIFGALLYLIIFFLTLKIIF